MTGIAHYFAAVAVALLACVAIASCGYQSSSGGEGDASVATDGGHWEQVDRSALHGDGPQNLAPVVAGDRVVVIAGVDHDQATVNGLIVDPESRRTSRMAPSHLWWRFGYSAVGAGDRVILWGGCCGPAGQGSREPGAIYDVGDDRWKPLQRGPSGDRTYHTAVWSGEEMIVWGGASRGEPVADGAAYDLRSDDWRAIAPAPLSPRLNHVAVWTGEEMIVWGGSRPRPREQERLLFDGASYDPERDQWRRIATTRLLGAPGAVLGAGDEPELDAVWTGEEMMIWSRYGGARYEPEADSWERIPAPPASIRTAGPTGTAIWTGEEMIVWAVEAAAMTSARTALHTIPRPTAGRCSPRHRSPAVIATRRSGLARAC